MHVAADSAIVPDVPFPGDDQGSIIYSTLSNIEDAAADALQKAEKALDGSVEPSTSGRDMDPTNGPAGSSNGSMPDPQNKPPVPHRWVIVGAMALAFVLCNMDKVSHLMSPCSVELAFVRSPLFCRENMPKLSMVCRSTCQWQSFLWRRSWDGARAIGALYHLLSSGVTP